MFNFEFKNGAEILLSIIAILSFCGTIAVISYCDQIKISETLKEHHDLASGMSGIIVLFSLILDAGASKMFIFKDKEVKSLKKELKKAKKRIKSLESAQKNGHNGNSSKQSQAAA